MGTIEERLEIFKQRADATSPVPTERGDIVEALAKVLRVTKLEADILVGCYELDDHDNAATLVMDYITRPTFMEEPT